MIIYTLASFKNSSKGKPVEICCCFREEEIKKKKPVIMTTRSGYSVEYNFKKSTAKAWKTAKPENKHNATLVIRRDV